VFNVDGRRVADVWIVIAPLSEMYGRLPLYVSTYMPLGRPLLTLCL
jgi:hypothetical protein